MTSTVINTSKSITLCTAKISALSFAMLLMQSNTASAATDTLVQLINNTAQASYNIDSETSTTISTDSNQVQVKASNLPEYGISLTQHALRTVMPNTQL